MVKTKIICTIGPASGKETVLRKMMLAGMDVVRLNFSHGSHDEHRDYISLVRALNKKYRRRIKVLGDLEGYRVRIGHLKGAKPIELKKHQTIWLTQKDVVGEGDVIPFDYNGPLGDIGIGQYIYIDDGNISLEVTGRGENSLKTKVIIGGPLKTHKGVNIPGVKLRFRKISEKDKKDIRFCMENEVEYLAQSFVRDENDILEVKRLLKGSISKSQVIAKIENREGIGNINDIIEVSDGIMIARGDMGISIPIYEIPMVQKDIIKRCNSRRRFVITATQMLESMTENRIPTRAEVTDVANAVIDGSDYLMLSAETAVGDYPVDAVSMMNKIIKFTEERLSMREK